MEQITRIQNLINAILAQGEVYELLVESDTAYILLIPKEINYLPPGKKFIEGRPKGNFQKMVFFKGFWDKNCPENEIFGTIDFQGVFHTPSFLLIDEEDEKDA